MSHQASARYPATLRRRIAIVVCAMVTLLPAVIGLNSASAEAAAPADPFPIDSPFEIREERHTSCPSGMTLSFGVCYGYKAVYECPAHAISVSSWFSSTGCLARRWVGDGYQYVPVHKVRTVYFNRTAPTVRTCTVVLFAGAVVRDGCLGFRPGEIA